MARRASRSRLVARALRVGALVLVGAGYLVAFGTTPTGQGLALLPHLALDPSTPLAAPTISVEAPADGPVLPTLRPSADADAEAPPPAAIPLLRVTLRGPDRVHESDAPTPPPVGVPVPVLDKHRVPTVPAIPAPSASVVAYGEPIEEGHSADLAVETPPPIGRS